MTIFKGGLGSGLPLKQAVTPGTSMTPVAGFGAAAPGSSNADTRILLLEQRVAELEAALSQVLAVFQLDNSGQKVKIKATTVEIEADMDVKVKAGCGLQLNAMSDLTLKSSGTGRLEAAASLEVKSPGTTKVKGSLLTLNDGTKFVARIGDPVVSSGSMSAVSSGNPSILA